MREAKIVVDMIQGELLPHAVCALAERADPSADRGHMLADGQVEALHERRVDLPATGRKHLLDRLQRAEHDAVADADQTPPAYGLDDLRIEQLWQGHPAGRGRGTCGLWRAWRCWGLCRNRHLLHLKVHVRIPALKNGAQLPVQRSYSRLQ